MHAAGVDRVKRCEPVVQSGAFVAPKYYKKQRSDACHLKVSVNHAYTTHGRNSGSSREAHGSASAHDIARPTRSVSTHSFMLSADVSRAIPPWHTTVLQTPHQKNISNVPYTTGLASKWIGSYDNALSTPTWSMRANSSLRPRISAWVNAQSSCFAIG